MWQTHLAASPTIRWLLTVPTGPEDQPGWLVNRLELDAAVIQKLRSLGYTQ